MAILVSTDEPALLVKKIKECIDEQSIDTWIYDKDGDFTHIAEQWKYRAWIRAIVEKERVVFSVICRNDANMTVAEYSVYHGRFVELLLSHFDHKCTRIEVTPLATSYDIIKPSVE